MMEISDAYMKEMIGRTKNYSVVILKATPIRNEPGADRIVWEHGRRNFALRAEGILSIVCPISDGTTVSGIGIFNADVEKTKAVMDGDPGVQAGIFTYEVHPCRAFPGDALPG
jgi:hypothetical protein